MGTCELAGRPFGCRRSVEAELKGQASLTVAGLNDIGLRAIAELKYAVGLPVSLLVEQGAMAIALLVDQPLRSGPRKLAEGGTVQAAILMDEGPAFDAARDPVKRQPRTKQIVLRARSGRQVEAQCPTGRGGKGGDSYCGGKKV